MQWRDDLGEVHSKGLKTDNEAIARTYLRALERSHGARRNNPTLKTARDALEEYLDEKRLGARPATIEMCRARLGPLFRAWASTPMHQWTRTLFVRYVADHTDWGPRSIQMFVGECRRFIRWAAAEGSGVACPDFVGEFRCPTLRQEQPKPRALPSHKKPESNKRPRTSSTCLSDAHQLPSSDKPAVGVRRKGGSLLAQESQELVADPSRTKEAAIENQADERADARASRRDHLTQ